MSIRLNSILMQPILILRNEKINSQVLVKYCKLENGIWSFTLNNTTKNIYKAFLESYCNDLTGNILFKESSSEFFIHPGVMTVSEKQIGFIISQFYPSENLTSVQYKISVCVRQKFGPDLGFHHIEL
ncbi:MAG: hypothetical protein JST55_16795 [Bacteroidetes bacterium]|nr:hypothetical protein [Bacteroidota bacterium]